jgi:hypothetical protein
MRLGFVTLDRSLHCVQRISGISSALGAIPWIQRSICESTK